MSEQKKEREWAIPAHRIEQLIPSAVLLVDRRFPRVPVDATSVQEFGLHGKSSGLSIDMSYQPRNEFHTVIRTRPVVRNVWRHKSSAISCS